MTRQIRELSIELKNSQTELEATVKARGEEQKEQPGVLLAGKQQAEQERDNAKAEVEKEQKRVESLQLELEAEKEETARYKAQAKIEASELAKSHAEKYKEMLRNIHLEKEKAVNVAVNAKATQPHDMIRKLLEGLAERRDTCNQPKEQEARKFEVINQIMWLETRESEALRTQLEAATNSLALETRRTRAAELANVTAAGEMTQEAAEIWELDTVLGTLEKIVGHAMFEDHKTERVETLRAMICEIDAYTKEVEQSASRNTSIQTAMRQDSVGLTREMKTQLKEIEETMIKEVEGRYNLKNKKQDFNSRIKMFMDETSKNAVKGSRLVTKLTALLLLDEIRHPCAAGSAAEGGEEVKTGAEAETVVTPAKITKDAWKESNQYKTLQGSLNKMTKERDQLIKGRDDLQCKLAEQTDKMVKLEYTIQKNSTKNAPEVTTPPEPKAWSTPTKRKTQPQVQAKPRCEERLQQEYAAVTKELTEKTDIKVKQAQEAAKVAEKQLRQAQEKITTLEKQVQQNHESTCANTTTTLQERNEDHAKEITFLLEEQNKLHAQWEQFHAEQTDIVVAQTIESSEVEKKARIKEMEVAVETAAQECRDAKQACQEWEVKHAEVKEQYDQLVSQKQLTEDKAAKEVGDLKRSIESLKEQTETLKIEKAELSDASKHTAGSNERAKAELEAKQTQIEQLQGVVARCKESEAAAAAEGMGAQDEDLLGRLKATEDSFQEAEQELQRANERCAQVKILLEQAIWSPAKNIQWTTDGKVVLHAVTVIRSSVLGDGPIEAEDGPIVVLVDVNDRKLTVYSDCLRHTEDGQTASVITTIQRELGLDVCDHEEAAAKMNRKASIMQTQWHTLMRVTEVWDLREGDQVKVKHRATLSESTQKVHGKNMHTVPTLSDSYSCSALGKNFCFSCRILAARIV